MQSATGNDRSPLPPRSNSSAMRRTVAFERTASEPEVLDRDMTPADIAAALQRHSKEK